MSEESCFRDSSPLGSLGIALLMGTWPHPTWDSPGIGWELAATNLPSRPSQEEP